MLGGKPLVIALRDDLGNTGIDDPCQPKGQGVSSALIPACIGENDNPALLFDDGQITDKCDTTERHFDTPTPNKIRRLSRLWGEAVCHMNGFGFQRVSQGVAA